MSTLTKILIVLLTMFTILLCGIVVTYVATAVNYKEKYDGQQNRMRALTEEKNAADQKRNETIKKAEEREVELGKKISSLEADINKLQSDLTAAKQKRDDAIDRADNWQAIATDFSKTTEMQVQLAKDAINDRNEIDTERIDNLKELEEKTASLIENMALIEQLEQQTRTLREEKTALQNKLDQILAQYGKTIPTPLPITQISDKARTAPPVTGIDLKGKISDIDINNSTIEISVGSADGVREKMIFHATRGDKFICDIEIFEVDQDKAVGTLDLVQDTPRIGDLVSTNL
ncbi:MAG: hypothetical protein JW715_12600 [Sedimentisphaerales bacterium]|nr:hypothetical protein [Sedimentisphaerales bacterium]